MKKSFVFVLFTVFLLGAVGRLLLSVDAPQEQPLCLHIKAEKVDNQLLQGLPDLALYGEGRLGNTKVTVSEVTVAPSLLTDQDGKAFCSALYSDVTWVLNGTGHNRRDSIFCQDEYMAVGMKKTFCSPAFYAEVRLCALIFEKSGA